MDYCSKHNRKMLISKFPNPKTGEKQYWCPDCYKEKKGKSPVREQDQGEQILAALRKIYAKLLEIEIKEVKIEREFREFTRIFGNVQTKETENHPAEPPRIAS